MSDTCTGCKFCVKYSFQERVPRYKGEPMYPAETFYGYECRFNPPVMVQDKYGNWPKVKDTDWCGKWEGK